LIAWASLIPAAVSLSAIIRRAPDTHGSARRCISTALYRSFHPAAAEALEAETALNPRFVQASRLSLNCAVKWWP